MRPGGIQDESSKHEQQTVFKAYRSQTTKARQQRRRYRHTQMLKGKMPRPISYTRQQVYRRTRQNGAVTLHGRDQLDRVVFTIYKKTASMPEALLQAANSQFIDPAFIKKLVALKDKLELVAAEIKMYRENNKEHCTLQLIKHAMVQLDEAVEHFAYLDKLLELEHAEL